MCSSLCHHFSSLLHSVAVDGRRKESKRRVFPLRSVQLVGSCRRRRNNGAVQDELLFLTVKQEKKKTLLRRKNFWIRKHWSFEWVSEWSEKNRKEKHKKHSHQLPPQLTDDWWPAAANVNENQILQNRIDYPTLQSSLNNSDLKNLFSHHLLHTILRNSSAQSLMINLLTPDAANCSQLIV